MVEEEEATELEETMELEEATVLEEAMELEEATKLEEAMEARVEWGICYGDDRPDIARGHDNRDHYASRSIAYVSSMCTHCIGSNRFGWL